MKSNNLGRGRDGMWSPPSSSWEWCIGSTAMWLVLSTGGCTKFLGCYKHLLSFCFVSAAGSELNDLNDLIVEKPNKTPNRQKAPNKTKNRGQENLLFRFLPSSHCSGSSQPSSTRWRIFTLLFGTCFLYLLRVRCCQVEEKNYLCCLSLTSYTCIFFFWFLRKERKCFSSKLPSERNTQERNTPVR